MRRVNEIRREDFLISAAIEPSKINLLKSEQLPVVKAGLVVVSKAKRPKTLSFSDAQRVEVTFRNSKNQEVYRWSIGKRFVQSIGTSMVMPEERLVFLVDVPLEKWGTKLVPGTYKVEAQLANYPEFIGTTNFIVKSD